MSEPDPIPYESPFPTCRVTATADPQAAVRVDLSRKRAAVLARRVSNTLDAHSGEALLDIQFLMGRRAYSHMDENLAQLLETDADVVQVVTTDDPDISVMVILNENQIRELDTATTRGLERADKLPNAGPFVWEVSVSENGAEMLVQQLAAAVKGADEPMDAVEQPGESDE